MHICRFHLLDNITVEVINDFQLPDIPIASLDFRFLCEFRSIAFDAAIPFLLCAELSLSCPSQLATEPDSFVAANTLFRPLSS